MVKRNEKPPSEVPLDPLEREKKELRERVTRVYKEALELIETVKLKERDAWSILDIAGNISGICNNSIHVGKLERAGECIEDLETYLRLLKTYPDFLEKETAIHLQRAYPDMVKLGYAGYIRGVQALLEGTK